MTNLYWNNITWIMLIQWIVGEKVNSSFCQGPHFLLGSNAHVSMIKDVLEQKVKQKHHICSVSHGSQWGTHGRG